MSTESPTIEVLFAGDDPPDGPTADELAAHDRFTVSRSRDFVDARQRATPSTVDCVVATHCEGGFDGLAFLEAVRQSDAELPVVLVASSVDAEVARRAVAADATALVPATDPEPLESVVEAIDAHVDRGRTSGERMPISDLTVEAERRLKERALDEAPVGITIADATTPDTPTIYMNDAFGEITGYTPEEVVGVNPRFLQGPETDPEAVSRLRAGIDTETETQVVLQNYRQDGSVFWNQVQISPIFDEDGEVSHYVGFQMDVTERKAAEEQLAAERERLDRLLDRLNGLINDTTEILVRAADREEIERRITERVGDGEEYTTAWLGRYDAADEQLTVTRQAGDHALDLDRIDLGAGGTDPDAEGTDSDAEGTDSDAERTNSDAEMGSLDPLREAVTTGEPVVIEESICLQELAAEEACVLVPLRYRSTTYGVLGVIARADALDDRERAMLGSLGRAVGTSINYALTKRTITTDTVLTIGVDLTDDDPVLVRLAADLDTQFSHEAVIANDREGLLVLVSTDHADPAAVVDRAAADDDVLGAEVLVETDDESVVQLRLAESALVDVLSEFGSRITSLEADGTTLSVEFTVGTESAAQSVLDTLRERYEQVDLMAYHESEPEQTAQGFREELRGRLTERQLTALKKAYVSGYFEWPRRVEGSQLAESMDIVPSTYHQHLQAAKGKLVAAFFEE
ncbi:MAG: bacterio-opsin activator domain-containing protein [Halohasta sp.]